MEQHRRLRARAVPHVLDGVLDVERVLQERLQLDVVAPVVCVGSAPSR